MVKRVDIHYVQCDCEQGKLELIASTNPAGSILMHNENGIEECGIFRATYFYGCDKCETIYAKYSHDDRIDISDLYKDMIIAGKIIKLQILRKYEGPLTKEEIIKYIRTFKGRITAEDEKKIIAERKK